MAVNVSLPGGACRTIEHVRVPPLVVHCGDVAETSATSGCAIPVTVIDTDSAAGETNSRPPRRSDTLFAGMAMMSLPRASPDPGWDPGAAEPPPHAVRAQRATIASARRRTGVAGIECLALTVFNRASCSGKMRRQRRLQASASINAPQNPMSKDDAAVYLMGGYNATQRRSLHRVRA
jgi:hypothetical protein